MHASLLFKAIFLVLCMYESGWRNKHSTVLTNAQPLRDMLPRRVMDPQWSARSTHRD